MKLFKYMFILFSTLFILNNASAKDLKINILNEKDWNKLVNK